MKLDTKKAYKDGQDTGREFDGSKGRDYTPGGPYKLGHRAGDSEKMRKLVEQNMADNEAWWKGFNETCSPALRLK